MNAELIACQAVEAPKAPGVVEIMPWGEFEVNGRKVVYAGESIPLVEQALAAKGVDIPIDYDHAMSTNPPANGIAPAAGWIKRLDLRPGEPMRAEVDWTPQGARHVSAREFRYLSPTFWARKDDGMIIGLHSVALVNKPAIAHMPPLAAREATASAADAAAERIGAMKHIAQCLGLAAEATEEQIVARGKELVAAAAQVEPLRNAVLVFAGEVGDDALAALAKDGSVELLSAGLQTAGLKLKHPAGMVAKADYEALASQISAMQKAAADKDCAALISANAKKLPPAKEEWFKKFYAADPVAASEWMKDAPELVSGERLADPSGVAPAGDRGALISSARAQVRSDPNVLWGGRSEREFISGLLLAKGQKAISDEEAAKLGV